MRKVIGLLCAMGSLSGKQVILNGNSSNSFLQNQITTRNTFNGSLDQSFGGVSTHTLGTSYTSQSICGSTSAFDQITGIVVQPDGKIVAAGYTITNDGSVAYFALARFTKEGVLDPSFTGGNGTSSLLPGTIFIEQSIANAPVFSAYDEIYAVALQPDGKIVVVGNTYNAGYYYDAVARFTTDGALDTTFTGGNGTSSFIPGTLFIEGSICGYSSYPADALLTIALQPDGKIVAGGWTSHGYTAPFYCAMVRFDSDGALDSTFTGGNGTTSLIPGTVYIDGNISGAETNYDVIYSLALQSDGSVVAGGFSANLGTTLSYAALMRFTQTGALDSSFAGGNGTLSIIPGTLYIPSICGQEIENTSDFIRCVTIDNYDTIIGVGATGAAGVSLSYCAAIQCNPNGSLDTHFIGGNGSVHSFPGAVYINKNVSNPTSDSIYDQLSAVVIQNNHFFIGGGYTQARMGQNLFCCARFTRTGALDTSFMGDGQTTLTALPGTVYCSGIISGSEERADEISSLAIRASGALVAGGYSQNSSGYYFTVAQFINPSSMSAYQKSYLSVGAGLLC